jgi:transketolase
MAPVVAHHPADAVSPSLLEVDLPDYGRERLADVAFLSAMTMVLMEDAAQSGHFGGPLAYLPAVVAAHLGGPALGALRTDLRAPKLPFADRFMLCGGHGIPACYALWMVLYEALLRERQATGRPGYDFDPEIAVLPIDALGFRRSAGACSTLLADRGLAGHPLFAQAGLRGIRALPGHSESTDVTNDVNGGPSGIGVSTAAGKALFLDAVGAPPETKVLAFEGEFAMTEGHAQEFKTAALAQQVGKRLRVFLSMNNAGIDDALIGGVIREEYGGYRIVEQWTSYGWNVFSLADANDFDQLLAVLKTMEEWPAGDRRPMIVVGRTTKGWWPAPVPDQITGHASHPWSFPPRASYVLALAGTFESRYGVRFTGLRSGKPSSEADRLVGLMTDLATALSILDRVPGLRSWIAERIVETAGTVPRRPRLRIDADHDPFLDERLRVANLPSDPVVAEVTDAPTGRTVSRTIRLFRSAGESAGARRAVSEIGGWLNHVTGGRFFTIAADLSSSINVEGCHFFGHYDPVRNPAGTRLPAPIQEAANTATILGLVSMNASEDPDRFAGFWGLSGTYGAFTPLMYTPARVFSQQKQDSPFRLGVLTVLAGHSGPETAADARTHFGIFAPGVWTLFPRDQVANLHCADYNDVAPAFFAAAERAARRRDLGILVLHVARPDAPVLDRSSFADPDPRAAARGIYLIRDFGSGSPRAGTILVQGASATLNTVGLLPRLSTEGLNVRVAAVVSEDLFRWAPEEYRRRVLPEEALFDCTFVTTGTKRVPPLAGLGPLAAEYALTADADDRWRSGGTEADLIAEARLDPESILAAIRRFAADRPVRLARQRRALDGGD